MNDKTEEVVIRLLVGQSKTPICSFSLHNLRKWVPSLLPLLWWVTWLYASDIRAYLHVHIHCLASSATAAELPFWWSARFWVPWKPGCRLTAWDSTHQRVNLPGFGTRQQLAKLDLAAIDADSPHSIFSPVFRNFGVTLDHELTFVPPVHPSIVTHSTGYVSSLTPPHLPTL